MTKSRNELGLRSDLIARRRHLAWREEALGVIAVAGTAVTVTTFAAVLAISRDLAVGAFAAVPALFTLLAGAWAVQTRIRSRRTGRRVATLRDVEERGSGAAVAGA